MIAGRGSPRPDPDQPSVPSAESGPWPASAPGPASDPWTASLDRDDLTGSKDRDGTGSPRAAADADAARRRALRRSPRARRIRFGVLTIALGAFAATWLVPLLRDPPPAPQPQVAVIGTHLDAPVELRLPAGAVTTSDGSYLGLRLPSGGAVMVTMPTTVVDPDGRQHRMPADPVAWLQHNPSVFVSRVQPIRVDGRTAVQVDYRWARTGQPVSRFASLQLFCGWRRSAPGGGVTSSPDGQACTRITAGARVRATFIPVGGRTVLVEMVWRDDAGQWPIPKALRQSYASLLQGLTARPV